MGWGLSSDAEKTPTPRARKPHLKLGTSSNVVLTVPPQDTSCGAPELPPPRPPPRWAGLLPGWRWQEGVPAHRLQPGPEAGDTVA